MTRKTLTVLFADLVEISHLYRTRGDFEAHKQVSVSLRYTRNVVENHHGSLLRTVGDAVLASFEKADSAFQAAVEIQKEHQKLNLSIRVGFHLGNVILDGGDVYGSAVNLAARIAAFCEADEICTSKHTINHLLPEHQSQAVYLNRVDFKGISSPIPVYRVQWRNDDAQTAVSTSLSRAQQHSGEQVLILRIGEKRIRIDESNPVVTIGRAIDNDVSVNIEPVSRNHAKIELAKGRFIIQDHSTNGTYIVRSGYTSEFIRRETIILESFGCIGLGFSPDDSRVQIIEYDVSAVA